jgi:rifampin ADP-ribosylating transferase
MLDEGPFYHGTIADLHAGDLLTAAFNSDYRPKVVRTTPTSPTRNPGNPTRSFRSSAPPRFVREVTDWTRLTPEALPMWRERLSALLSVSTAEIIN